MKPTLGVLITYYNERQLLRECLESVRAQTEMPDEILIYDDASEAPPEPHVPPGISVKIIRGQVNRGPSFGRNQLLQASRSDYIHFHDADDLFFPEWCQRAHQALEETGTDVVFTEVSSYVEEKLLCGKVLGLERLARGADLVRFCIQGGMLGPSGTYRRGAVLAIGGYRESIWQSEDYDFHIRLAASGVRYAVITEPLVRTRIRPTSRSSNQEEVWSHALKAIEFLVNEVSPQYHPDLANAAIRAGAILFRIGAREKAREAFRTAYRIGPPDFREMRRLYRWIAKAFGPEMTEWLSAVYRKMVPVEVRRFVQEMGL